MKNVKYFDFLEILDNKKLNDLCVEVINFRNEHGHLDIDINYVYKGCDSYWSVSVKPSKLSNNARMYIQLTPSKNEFLDFDYIVNYVSYKIDKKVISD